MTSYFISGAQDHASSITQADVEIRIFENSSFSLGYAGFPIHADKSKIVYVEVEGRRSSFILWHVSRTGNKQTTFLLFLTIYPLSIACYVTQENDVLVLYYKVINKNE